MEYLQYKELALNNGGFSVSFKPCYKWNTFNTTPWSGSHTHSPKSFKPCYKWNTFNTMNLLRRTKLQEVLNLVISGIPSILNNADVLDNMSIMF